MMKTQGAWAQAILKCIDEDIKPVPKGWFTSKEIGVQLGVNSSSTTRCLQILKSKNMVEHQRFRIRSGKLVRLVEHYRLK